MRIRDFILTARYERKERARERSRTGNEFTRRLNFETVRDRLIKTFFCRIRDVLLESGASKYRAGNIWSTYANSTTSNVTPRTIYLRDISIPVCRTVRRVLSENSIARHTEAHQKCNAAKLTKKIAREIEKKRTGERVSE